MATDAPDRYVRITTTIPARLLAAADARALATRRTRAAYLADLVRADLAGAGLDVPEPPPPKRNGPKPRRSAGKVRGEKKNRGGA